MNDLDSKIRCALWRLINPLTKEDQQKELRMFSIKIILVATDFSAASDLALRYGRAMAETFGANLRVLHVCDDPILFADTTSDEYRDQTMRNCLEELQENVRQVTGDSENLELLTKCGSAATEIVYYAKDENIDMIVMGSHGRSAMASMLLGNVAEHVVRHSPCPVTTVRSPEHDF